MAGDSPLAAGQQRGEEQGASDTRRALGVWLASTAVLEAPIRLANLATLCWTHFAKRLLTLQRLAVLGHRLGRLAGLDRRVARQAQLVSCLQALQQALHILAAGQAHYHPQLLRAASLLACSDTSAAASGAGGGWEERAARCGCGGGGAARAGTAGAILLCLLCL